MNILRFMRTREWVMGRRLALIAVILFLGFRTYGSSIYQWFQLPRADRDIVITKSEFRPDLNGVKPAWIIGFRNTSRRFTYDKIEMEATYFSTDGKVMQTDKLIVQQKLEPGEEQLLASSDIKNRPGATGGTLRVIGAASVAP